MVDPPRYQLIARELRSKIESGKLKPGSQLPTELELREIYNASRNTVRDAMKSLVNDGLIVAYRGKGTFVKHRIIPFVITLTQDPETGFGGGEGHAYEREIEAQNRQPSASDPRVGLEIASPYVAAALELEPEAVVVSRRQERYIDEIPWSLQTSYYPRRLVERGASRLADPHNLAEGTVRYLQETLGIEQAGYTDRLRVRAMKPDEGNFFALQAGSQRSVLESTRVTYDRTGVPVRLTESIFHPDRTEIAINVGEIPPTARERPRAWSD